MPDAGDMLKLMILLSVPLTGLTLEGAAQYKSVWETLIGAYGN